jgi:hypothetical protein
MRVAGYQTSMPSIEIKPRILIHNFLLPLLFRQRWFYFKNN